MSTVKKKSDGKKAATKKDQPQTRKSQSDAKKADARGSRSIKEPQVDAEAIVREAKDGPSAVVNGPKDEAASAEGLEESPILGSRELEDMADQSLALQENTTRQTVGANLAQVQDDRKSFAATEKQNVQDDDFVDMKMMAGNIDKYSEGNVVKDEQSEEEHLGFMDEEEIQPKQSAAMLEQHLQHINSSWKLVEEIGLERFGVVFFKNIIKFCPESLSFFPFKDVSNMYQSDIFKSHVLKVMQGIEKTIRSLPDLEQLKNGTFPKLELENSRIGITRDMSEKAHKCLIMTLEAGLKQSFTPQAKLGWESLYQQTEAQIINCIFSQAGEAEEDDDTLTPQKIKLIEDTWRKAYSLGAEQVGLILFKNIFTAAPEVMQLFSFKSVSNLHKSAQLKRHGAMVVDKVNDAVGLLNNLDVLVPVLQGLGKDHVPRGIKPEHYPVVGQALIDTLEAGLGKEFTPQARRAWEIVYKVIADTMIGGNYSKQPTLPYPADETMQNSMIDNSIQDMLPKQVYDDNDVSVKSLGTKVAQDFLSQPSMNQLKKEEIKDHYLKLFRKEVDFHHKIAYRFEKGYRLGRKQNATRQNLNLEIIDCISEHSGYIEQDPMALFYCLFFCIQYSNEPLVEFLRNLIQKIRQHNKIDKLLEYIDVNGIQRIRTEGEQIKQIVYHMVFYQAVDDDLRIVYYQIMRNIKFLQLRDKDAIHLLNTRDYELIKLSFERNTTKINLALFFDFGPEEKVPVLKCAGYRRYTPAYYEVIIIYNEIESRVALNYRERFLVSPDDIYNVFQMYCKEDFDKEFTQTKKDDISHQQFIELFITCLRNDSFQIATLIYTVFLKPSEDMDQKMMDILMSTIKDSVKYHEMKLFFIHEHFDVMTIAQMNYLIDIYQDILNIKDPKQNPIINQFNTIKIALLIFRICWKIEQKQIYSLITKCSLLQSLLIRSLSNYFEKQNNILVLYKFMSEPILHMSERKDSLDIMYEMNMQELLKHPVVIEVLNLVYEGKYSVSQSALSMSQTFQCMLDMDTMSLKSITERLVQNIVNFGDTGSAKQTSMQYNIWKQSIQQRESDEMVFTVIISMFLIGIAIALNQSMNVSFIFMREHFEEAFIGKVAIFTNADDAVLTAFCPTYVKDLKEEYGYIQMFSFFIMINTLGMFTQVVQKLTIFRVKDNVTLNFIQICLEASIAAVGVIFILLWNEPTTNQMISNICGQAVSISPADAELADKVFQMKNPRQGELNLNLLISAVVAQSCIISIIMLQRTQYLGQLIMMLQQMMNEFFRFFLTFGLIIGLFILMGRMLGNELKTEHTSFFEVFLDLFNAFNGNMQFGEFKMPIGQTFIAIFMFLFKVMFLSLLAAMFINRYKQVFKNLDAYRRFNIIKLKNSVAYDKFVGGATLTFFPINILVLPFVVPIIFLRSARLSDTLLKLQYVVMMLMYCVIAMTFVVPVSPILYCKVAVNAIFIAMNNKRQDYRGQNIVMLIFSVIVGPIAITVSILIDLLSLPNTLLKESKGFEHKYQLSSDRLNDAQIKVVMETFSKIFYGQNFQGYKGQHMTLIQLMMMHRRIFSIVDNLHDLTCRGNKDYKQALSNVQDYNMTKILTRKCAIPDKNGDYKEGKCELDVIYAVQMDIEIYNYVDVLLRKNKMGILVDEMRAKARGSNIDPQSAGEAVNDVIEEVKAAGLENDEEDEETKKVDGINQIGIGPDGVPLKRNNSDVFNNFHIQFAVLSFTDLETQLIAVRNNGELKRNQKFEKEVENRKAEWKKQTVGTFQEQVAKYDNFIKGELGLKKKPTDVEPGEFESRKAQQPWTQTSQSPQQVQTESTDSNEKSKSQKNPQSLHTKKASTQHLNRSPLD